MASNQSRSAAAFAFAAIAALASCAPAGRDESTVAQPALALTHVTVIDGRGRPPLTDVTVVVRGGRIAAVVPSARTVIPRAARVLEPRDLLR